ncbi:MAG: TonB-dependent receptor [Chitinophagaceae bacterium]
MKRLLFIIVICLTTLFSFSQQRVEIRGTVVNAASTPVPAATVHLMNTNFTTQTSTRGVFSIRDVPAGSYRVEITAIGYANTIKTFTVSENAEALSIVLTEAARQLDAVIVTAQKREEALQQIPASISSISSRKVDQYRLWNARDLTGIVPNLYSADPGDARNVTSIRGITTTSYDPAIATYIDGVNQFGLDTYIAQLIDIDRIEILRGPQGTLYGRNAMGGVINIITRQPSSVPNGFAEINVGNYGQQRYAAGFQAPLVKDKLYLGVAEVYDTRNGFYRNDYYNTRFEDQHSLTGNYTLRYQANSRWVFSGNVKHQLNRNNGPFPLASDVQSAFANPFHLSQDAVSKMVDNTLNASFSMNHTGKNVNFSAQTSYQSNHRYYTKPLDGDFSPIDGVTVVNNYGNKWNKLKVLTQEIRLSSPNLKNSPWQWTAGLYAFYQDNPVKQGTHFGKDAALVGAPDSFFTVIGTSKGKNFGSALFGQATYTVNDQWSITGGLRYDYEFKKQSVLGEYQPDASPVPIFNTQADTSSKTHFGALSPKLIVDYKFTDVQHVYASYSRGFRAGGFTQLSSDPSVPPLFAYKPEYSNNLELGFKNSLFDQRLIANLSFFYTEVNDVQVPTLVLPDAVTITRNAGKLISRGVELEFQATPVKGLQVEWNFGINKATYDVLKLSQNGTVNNLKGKRQLFTPDVTSMLAAQYSLPLDKKAEVNLLLRGEWFYLGTQYFDLANTIRQSPYQLLNTRFGISYKSYELMFWGRNLSDEKYISYAFDFGAVHLGNPKTVGVTFKARF